VSGPNARVGAEVVEATLPAEREAVVDGRLAAALTGLFVDLRDCAAALPDGGGALVVVSAADVPVLDGAVRALVRSLAREVATRGCRINAILAAPGTDTSAAQAFLRSPAAIMLTGAVLRANAHV
jgi:NAD(P)-dependent dehydrogenase (short-subunit alcohol dehydrogenase family)